MKCNKKIENIISSMVQAIGYDLWAIELHQSGKHTLVRIYIDVLAGSNNCKITHGDCSKVSNQIGVLLDVEDVIAGGYNLEVSSPGIDRPLYNAKHYQRYIGEEIKVKLQQALNGQRNYVGTIKSVSDDKVELIAGDENLILEFTNIAKANLNVLGL